MKDVLRIKEILEEKGMTLRELASILGIHHVTLSQNLSRNPTITTLQKIADALNVEIADLFSRKSEGLICPHCKKPIEIDVNVK